MGTQYILLDKEIGVMFKIYMLLALATVTTFIPLSAQDWVKDFGHREGDVIITGLVTDSKDHVLITGTFSSEELVLEEGHVLTSQGMEDVFIVKYDPQGRIAWAKSFGGIKQDRVADIALDHLDNIYITGDFTSNTLHIGGTEVSSVWPENVYVARFDSSGVFRWLSKSSGLTGYSWSGGTAVHCQGNGLVYFAGFTSSQELSFGDINLSMNNSNSKGFYGSLDEDGNFQSAYFLGDEGEDRYQLHDITTDPQGNIYLAGKRTIHTEPDPITYQEYWDMMYFCKTDSEGKIEWTIEDTALYMGQKVLFNNGALYVLGNREEYRYIFNGGTIDTTSSFFFGHFDTDGNRLMGRKITGAMAYGLYADDNRILVAGGLYLDHLELDGTWLHRNSDSSSICPIYQDIFFFEADQSGQIWRVFSISGSLEDAPTNIWLSSQGDLYYTGKFESASLEVEENTIHNLSELSTFNHVSGTYYDRRQYSFLARRAEFTNPGQVQPPSREPLNIYPNPSSGLVQIQRQNLGGTALIRIYDLRGHLLSEYSLEGELLNLDLSDLGEGMFIVLLKEEGRMTTGPLLIIP
jgi:hypothetical protein